MNVNVQPAIITIHEIPNDVIKKLHRGNNLLAMHCTNTGGDAWLDAGIGTRKLIRDIEPANQKAVYVTATQTKYLFSCGAVNLEVDFLSPLLANNLDMLSRPVSFIHFSVTAKDNGVHAGECFICRKFVQLPAIQAMN